MAPTPPQTKPQRRNFMVAIDAANPADAEKKVNAYLEEKGFSFLTIQRTYNVTQHKSGDMALDTILDQARRHGVGHALYL